LNCLKTKKISTRCSALCSGHLASCKRTPASHWWGNRVFSRVCSNAVKKRRFLKFRLYFSRRKEYLDHTSVGNHAICVPQNTRFVNRTILATYKISIIGYGVRSEVSYTHGR